MESTSDYFEHLSTVFASITNIPIELFDRIDMYVDAPPDVGSLHQRFVVRGKLAQRLLLAYGWKIFCFDTMVIDSSITDEAAIGMFVESMQGGDVSYILFGITEDNHVGVQHWIGAKLICDPLGKPLKSLLRLESGERILRIQVLVPTPETVKMVADVCGRYASGGFNIESAAQGILADLQQESQISAASG